MYVATINIPGYLPMGDDPPVFDTTQEAWEYLLSEVELGYADDGLPAPGEKQLALEEEIRKHAGEPGTVYGPTPGYEGDHDLGLAYTVSVAEDAEPEAPA